MALYRFLFAPVLLAVAVLMGSRERAATPPPSPPAAEAQHAPARAASVVPTGARAARTQPVPVR